MKCYCMTYDLTKVAPKTVYVSKNSTFKIGIRVKTASGYDSESLTLEGASGELSPAGYFEDYLTWKLTSAKQEEVALLEVKYAGDSTQVFKLKVITTGSDVAELDSLGAEDAYTPENTSLEAFSGTFTDGTSFSFSAVTK